MKPLFLLLLSFLLACSARAQAPKTTPTSKKDECSVAGMVVKLAGSEPLRKGFARKS